MIDYTRKGRKAQKPAPLPITCDVILVSFPDEDDTYTGGPNDVALLTINAA